MTKKVTFGQIHCLLLVLGWVQTPVEGKHVLFEHKPLGALLAFRPHRLSEQVDPMTLSIVKWNLEMRGFLEEEEFPEALRKASTNGRAKTTPSKRKARVSRK